MGHGLAAALSRWKTGGVAAPADLEALVRAELREPIAALVRRLVPELVAEQVNGHANGAQVVPAAPERPQEAPSATEGSPIRGETLEGLRACSTCGEPKPPGEFSPGHYACKACRRPQERERARRRAAAKASEAEPEG
jgi:hypothetical protein